MITTRNLYKTFNQNLFEKAHTALADVSFDLKQGQTLGLVGANGAGKSTALRLLMGFLRPDQGQIRIFGQSPSHHLVRQRIGYLPETASFPSNLTILDMVRFAGKAGLMPSGQIARASETWLKALGLWEVRRRPLRQYSKGMQQRANFTLALLNDPDLLILDEPMSGLDPFGRADILNLILDLKQKGKTILFCSHILEDVDRLVDHVLILHKGRNLFHGNVAELCKQQQVDSFVNAFLNIVNNEGTHAEPN